MSYLKAVPRVLLAHGALVALLLLLPLLRNCRWFPKPDPEVIEVSLADLPPLPAPPPEEPAEPDKPEEEEAIPDHAPVPTPRPTAFPNRTPTPAPTADPTPHPTATPKPPPPPTPTPQRTYLTPEQIRERIRNQQNPPEPAPAAPTMSPEDLARMLGQGLPAGGGPAGIGTPGGSSGVSFQGVAAELSSRLYSAWNQPRHLSSASGLAATAEVTVSRSGNVTSSRITRSSGNSEFDRSVQSALSSVSFAKPLPDSYSASSKTFPIEFKLSD